MRGTHLYAGDECTMHKRVSAVFLRRVAGLSVALSSKLLDDSRSTKANVKTKSPGNVQRNSSVTLLAALLDTSLEGTRGQQRRAPMTWTSRFLSVHSSPTDVTYVAEPLALRPKDLRATIEVGDAEKPLQRLVEVPDTISVLDRIDPP